MVYRYLFLCLMGHSVDSVAPQFRLFDLLPPQVKNSKYNGAGGIHSRKKRGGMQSILIPVSSILLRQIRLIYPKQDYYFYVLQQLLVLDLVSDVFLVTLEVLVRFLVLQEIPSSK